MEKPSKRFSGEGAVSYDTYLGPFVFEPSAGYMASLIDPVGVLKILEIAAGTGRVTRHLRKRFPVPVSIIATDLSADMLEIAKRKLRDNSIDFQTVDAQELPFPENSFDLVVCQYGIMFVPDKQKAIDEAFRVLKPGGKFYFSTWENAANIPINNLVLNKFILPYIGYKDSEKLLVPFSMHDPAQLLSLLTHSGFVNTKVVHATFMGESPSPLDLVNGYLLKNPFGKELRADDPAGLDRMAAEMEQAIGEKFGSNPVRCELFAFFANGEKQNWDVGN